MKSIILLLFGLLSLVIHVLAAAEKEVVLNAVAFGTGSANEQYIKMIMDFNNYAKSNGLNTRINYVLHSMDNSTSSVQDYESMLEAIFSKKTNKQDIVFYDTIYAVKFEPHLLDLRDVMPKETIDMYMEGVASQTCVVKDKIVGFPVSIDYTVLYYNEQLLKQYGKSVPKTWDQLIEIGEDIRKQSGNSTLVYYNGLYDKQENYICSLYEFLYSYRNEVNSPFPDITSDEAVEALEKIKEIKNRISSDDEFRKEDMYTINALQSNNFLFLKYWYMPGVPVKSTLMPGKKEGISGAIIGGYNIGINVYSKIEKKEKAIEAIKYLVSKDIQRKYIANADFFSPIPSLYDEEEVCKKVDCNHYKSVQLIGRPINKMDNYDAYTDKVKEYVSEYLFGDDSKKAIDSLNKIEDITRIYNLSLSTEESSVGFIVFVLITATIVVILLSLIFPFIKKFKPYFVFLPNDFWISFIIGLIFILCPFYLEIGKLSLSKCFLKIPFIMIGLTLNYIPIFYKLVVCIPENNNKVSMWVYNHRHQFLYIFIMIDFALLLVMCFFPYTLKTEYVVDGKNFQTCQQKSKINNIIYYLFFAYKFIVFLISFVFIFMEWNISFLHREIRLITATLYMNIIIVIVFIILTNVVLDKTKNYIVYSVVRLSIYYAYTIINYVLLYGYRIFGPILFKEDPHDIYKNSNAFRNAMKNSSYNLSAKSVSTSSDYNNHQSSSGGYNNSNKRSSMLSKVSSKIMKCHYQKNLDTDIGSSPTSPYKSSSSSHISSNYINMNSNTYKNMHSSHMSSSNRVNSNYMMSNHSSHSNPMSSNYRSSTHSNHMSNNNYMSSTHSTHSNYMNNNYRSSMRSNHMSNNNYMSSTHSNHMSGNYRNSSNPYESYE